MPPAHVLFARDGGLWAREVKPDLSIVEGEPLPVAPKVLVDPSLFGYSAFSTSSTGSIACRAAAAATRLVWLDRAGRQVGALGQPDDSQMMLNQASRDGRAIAVTRTIEGRTNVWLVDRERGTPRRLTFDVNDNAIVISPEGDWIAHQATGPRDGSVVYRRRSDGTGTATVLLEESVHEWHQPMDWSGDGRHIVFAAQTPTGPDLRVLPVSGGGAPFDIATTPFAESRFGESRQRHSPSLTEASPRRHTTSRLAHHSLAMKGGLNPEIAKAIAEGRRPEKMADH